MKERFFAVLIILSIVFIYFSIVFLKDMYEIHDIILVSGIPLIIVLILQYIFLGSQPFLNFYEYLVEDLNSLKNINFNDQKYYSIPNGELIDKVKKTISSRKSPHYEIFDIQFSDPFNFYVKYRLSDSLINEAKYNLISFKEAFNYIETVEQEREFFTSYRLNIYSAFYEKHSEKPFFYQTTSSNYLFQGDQNNLSSSAYDLIFHYKLIDLSKYDFELFGPPDTTLIRICPKPIF